jgi:DNA-binding response OmpR family regulator
MAMAPARSTGVVIDADAREARVRGHAVALTRQELDLLRVLVTNRDIVWSRAMLLHAAWQDDPYMTARTVDVVVASLRRKIERDANEPRLIIGVPNVGYRLGDDD